MKHSIKLTRSMSCMSAAGDDVVAEWDVEASPERMAEVEAEFNAKMKEGYFAADLATNEVIHEFRDTDIVLIPRITGGSR